MFSTLDCSAGSVIGIKASGTLTHKDYEQLMQRLEHLVREYAEVRVLFDLEECQGWDFGASWDDLRLAIGHGDGYERCAVVGERKWQEWMARLSKPFFRQKFFDKSEREQAWHWLREGIPCSLAKV